MTRILKGWTKDEREELESAPDNGYFNLMDLMNGIVKDYSDLHHIHCKYYGNCDDDENNQLVKDIVDYCTSEAKFPEQKYCIKAPKMEHYYLVKYRDHAHRDDGFGWTQIAYENECRQTKFTMNEIKAIDPRYEAFAVAVEDDDE